jgi:hypothetical protein
MAEKKKELEINRAGTERDFRKIDELRTILY